MLKLLTVIGARPQFIKAAAVSQVLNNDPDIKETLVHTGQHFDPEMSDIFFEELKIPQAKYNLNIQGQTHGLMTGRMLEAIEKIILDEKPDAVVVYGDTNSTLAGALAAAKLHVPVCHIESGLRSFNKKMPEEINRVMTDHLSSLLFCPTQTSISNLKNEGIIEGVHHVGDVMYDIALKIAPLAKGYSKILDKYNLKEKQYGLSTIHRAENTNSPETLKQIIHFLKDQAKKEKINIILPMHPRTKKLSKEFALEFDDIIICDPVGYLDMQCLIQHAAIVYTDSGGLQKEAYFYQVPCITLRNETEWVETIQSGWNRLWKDPDFIRPRVAVTDFGIGLASENIKDLLKQSFR